MLQTVLTFDLFSKAYPALPHWVSSTNKKLVSITYVRLR